MINIKKYIKGTIIFALGMGTLIFSPNQTIDEVVNVSYATSEKSEELQSDKNLFALENLLKQVRNTENSSDYSLATASEKEDLTNAKNKLIKFIEEYKINSSLEGTGEFILEVEKMINNLSKTPFKDRVIDFERPLSELKEEYLSTVNEINSYIKKDSSYRLSVQYNDVDKDYQGSYIRAMEEAKKVYSDSSTTDVNRDSLNSKQKSANGALSNLKFSIDNIRKNSKRIKKLVEAINSKEIIKESSSYLAASDTEKKSYEDIIKEIEKIYNSLISDKNTYTQEQVDKAIEKYNKAVEDLGLSSRNARKDRISKLKESIKNNEVVAGAARYLLKNNKKSTESFSKELEGLLKKSEELIREASELLKTLED